jgi:hypothetical protein
MIASRPCAEVARLLAGALALALSTGCADELSCRDVRRRETSPVRLGAPWSEMRLGLPRSTDYCVSDAAHFDGIMHGTSDWYGASDALLASLRADGWTVNERARGGGLTRSAAGVSFYLRNGDRAMCGYVTPPGSRVRPEGLLVGLGTFGPGGHCAEWDGL